MTWAQEASAKYGPIAAGLVIGTAAKYGLTLTEGDPITWRKLAADLLLQGVLGLVAIAVSDVLNLQGNARVFIGALVALNGARLVKWVRDTFYRRVQQSDLIGAIKSTDGVAEVPAGPAAAPPTAATLTIFRSADPRAGGIERLAQGKLPSSSAELDTLLDKLEQP